MNFHENASYRGIEVLYHPIHPNNQVLGKILIDQFKLDFSKVRTLKKTNLYLYSNTRIPGVLIECGFLSNYHDRVNLQDKNYQKSLANSITKSVITYFDTISKKESS